MARLLKDGFAMIDPEVSKALISIRGQLDKADPPQGRNEEIAIAAFNEINEAHGNHSIRTMCCGKWSEVKRILNNWLKQYDRRGKVDQVRLNPPTVKKLKPIKEKYVSPIKPPPQIVDYSKLSWSDLKAEAKKQGIKIHSKKKAQILKELNG